ncbi:MAG: glycoside hydrolase family 31 protein [Sandaracinaceae bacterium]|nr:glycoside hydrolase family 31 protein [Sandaracinaceae bacterium]
MRVIGSRMGWAALAVLGACGSAPAADGGADAALDAATDAGPATPQSIAIGDDVAMLRVETDPLRITVTRADGTEAIASIEPAISIGSAANGDRRYHDPTQASPRGVTFHGLDRGLSSDATTLRVSDGEGRVASVAIEAPARGVYRVRVEVDPSATDIALMRMGLRADARGTYQGLGERFYGSDARGWVVPMQLALGGRASGTNEHHVPIPFFASSNGYGVFVQSREAGAFDVGASDPTQVRATFEGRVLDVFFYVDGDPREVVAMYTRQTGLPILPPRWAFAPMHWRNEWDDRSVLEEDALRIRAEDIPCTSFWIDNPWQVSYNDLTFDETRFPGSQDMLDQLRARGYVPLVWSTPYLDAPDGGTPQNPAEALHVQARDAGWLVAQAGATYLSPASPGATGGLLDFTSEGATAFWQARIEAVVDRGVRAFKLDYGEDILVELLGARTGFELSDGTTERETHNVFNTLYHVPYRRALDARAGTDGGFLLVRASSWGGQSLADVVWPGDLDNDLREAGTTEVGGLPAAISALVSLAASGFPSFGSDTGGYRGGMPARESLLRWAEHTAFTPILQLGGAGDHHNPWLYDAEAGAIYRALARAHMDLVPFWRAHARRASTTGYPPVAHPSMVWPNETFDDPYCYVLGDTLFVAPVIEPSATQRTLRLPPGRWVHWFTREVFDGPRDLTIDAPIGTPPVFVRAGSIVPLLPEDLDTLIEADPPLVGPSQRPYLRAWILPGAARSVSTEEGPVVAAERTSDGIDLRVEPSASMSDVRLEVELAAADPPLASVTSVSLDGTPLAPSAAGAVRAGCDGACYAIEGATLWISVRRADASTLAVR